MTYQELDINQKINLKATLQAWAAYSIQHFQGELNKKVYGLRINKKGVQRSALGKGYTFGSGKSRTNQLRRAWWQRVNVGNVDEVVLEFMLYGRFVDMGVGRGVGHSDRLVNRMLKLGPTTRTRKPWYSKRKGYEIKRLREILAQQNINLMLDLAERALTLTVAINR